MSGHGGGLLHVCSVFLRWREVGKLYCYFVLVVHGERTHFISVWASIPTRLRGILSARK
jgi:hypothetical protein